MFGVFFTVDSNFATSSLTYGGQIFSDLFPVMQPIIYVAIAGLALSLIFLAFRK